MLRYGIIAGGGKLVVWAEWYSSAIQVHVVYCVLMESRGWLFSIKLHD